MANVDEMKRRLLREAVKENIATVHGVRSRPVQPVHRDHRTRLRKSFLIVGLVALIASLFLFSTLTGYHQEVANLLSSLMTTEPPSLAANQVAIPEVPFSEPQPLDGAVFPLGLKKIVLDPGHGGNDLGAVAPLGIEEKEVTLDIALRLRRLLEEASFEILMTRKKDEVVTLAQRAAFANSTGADIFVSIHVNWITSPRIRSVETYYLGPTDDPHSVQLASMENRESGYSLADFRRLLEGIYVEMRRDHSRRLAEVLHRELFKSLGQVNPVLKNGGVKRAPFIVLVATDMPAILVEVSCLSNEEEARRLATSNYRQEIAQALFKGIRSYADTLNSPNKKGS